jgi:hypothetical protein
VNEQDLEFLDYAELLDLRDAIDRRLEAIRQANDEWQAEQDAHGVAVELSDQP